MKTQKYWDIILLVYVFLFERNFGWFCNPFKIYEEHGTKEKMFPLYPGDNYARYTLECI